MFGAVLGDGARRIPELRPSGDRARYTYMKAGIRTACRCWFRGLIAWMFACGVCGALATQAHANPTNSDVQRADRLFAEGKTLLASDLQQACEKFDESLHYNPAAIGTLLNVALCDEKFGRVASAVTKFTEARILATEQGLPQHTRAAEEHIAAIAPSVPHLVIKLTEPIPAIQIVIDDRVVALDASNDVAVDPGERVIIVTAPGRLPFRSKLVINKFEHRQVVVPPLEASLVVRSSQRRIGQISTVAGGIAIATGIGIGLYARNLYLSAFGYRHVPGDGLCDAMKIFSISTSGEQPPQSPVPRRRPRRCSGNLRRHQQVRKPRRRRPRRVRRRHQTLQPSTPEPPFP